MNFLDILLHTLPVFLLVAVGYMTRVLGVVTDESENSIMRLAVNVLYPCFILSKVPGNESLQQYSVVGVALATGFLLTLIGLLVSRIVGIGFKISKDDGLNTFSVSAAIQNYGFIPIPLIMALFVESADETLGVLFVHNLGLEFAMWTVGIVLLSGTVEGAIKRLVNGPTIAITCGLILNFSGLHSWIPSFANTAIADLGNCAIPIGLLLVGAAMASVITSQRWETNWNIVSGALLVRFLIMPFVFLCGASAVSFSPELRRVLIVESAMPAAIFPIVLAKHFGGKPAVAVQVCIATSLASLMMTPLLLVFGLEWFGISI